MTHTIDSVSDSSGEAGEGFIYTLDLDPRDYELVVLLSDGARSFQRRTAPGRFGPIGLEPVVQELLSLKSTSGEFMLRRIRRFLTRTCARLGWHHSDDLAAAAIWLGDEGAF